MNIDTIQDAMKPKKLVDITYKIHSGNEEVILTTSCEIDKINKTLTKLQNILEE